jgi:hypothetical protein
MSHGRLQFSEEMGRLVARFREVELTLETPSAVPTEIPKSWLQVESEGVVVRFVESEFDEQRTRENIEHVFGGGRDINYRGMSLREIFLATARREAEV